MEEINGWEIFHDTKNNKWVVLDPMYRVIENKRVEVDVFTSYEDARKYCLSRNSPNE